MKKAFGPEGLWTGTSVLEGSQIERHGQHMEEDADSTVGEKQGQNTDWL